MESFKAWRSMVSHTPMIKRRCVFRSEPVRVFAKNEQRNMTGSVKNRMALWILRPVFVSCAGSGRARCGA